MAPKRRRRASVKPLRATELRWHCKPSSIPYASTAQTPPATGVLGQDAAVESLRFGLQFQAPGQNVFVRGLTGTGRLTLVRRLLQEIQPGSPVRRDHCYVHNFSQADRPRLISLAAGQGAPLKRHVAELTRFIREGLPTILTSEGTRARRTALQERAEKAFQELVEPFQKTLRENGLSLVTLQAGALTQNAIFPLVDGKPMPPEQFEQLHAQGEVDDEVYQGVTKKMEEFGRQLAEIQLKMRDLHKKHSKSMQQLLESTTRQALADVLRGWRDQFEDPRVQEFLDEVVEDVIQNRLPELAENTDFTRLYEVNVVLDREGEEACPIVAENTPTMRNLLGSIDYDVSPDGDVSVSHMGIRAGSLLRADGGYLILEAHDVLSEPGSWKVLLRTLRTGRLEVVPHELTMFRPGPTLTPEPIEIRVKVVLLGNSYVYYLLDRGDPDFADLFKVLVDFDSEIPRDANGLHHYAAVLARIAQEEELLPFDRGSIAALAEHGARIAARRGKLTARFGRLADIAREASFLARQHHRAKVTGEDVREAVQRGKDRGSLPSRRFRELVSDGTIRVQTSGEAVGQVNGLAVLGAGPITYGFPTRITATIGPGTVGVINIEREAELSGAIHTKGFYILGGLLRHLLRTEHPLAFSASIAFEQSYGGIDGDSASGAEMCCLLSALTDVPLRQNLAMTGAIDQMGNVLAIGAVNEKIEGFFDACLDQGDDHAYGVIIPRANAGDLMLRHDVVEACRAGHFQVFAVEDIRQALELFTGIVAGEPDDDGQYPEGSLLGMAMTRAREYWLKASMMPNYSTDQGD